MTGNNANLNKYFYSNKTLYFGSFGLFICLIFIVSYIVEMERYTLEYFSELRKLKQTSILSLPVAIYYFVLYSYRKLVPLPILYISDKFVGIQKEYWLKKIAIKYIAKCEITEHEKAISLHHFGKIKPKKTRILEITYKKHQTVKKIKIRCAYIEGDVEEAVSIINSRMLDIDDSIYNT